MSKSLIIYTDGGSRGNPGPAGIGVVIMDENRELIDSYGKYLGRGTNNQAEYEALLSAIERAIELKGTDLKCYLDSLLVVKQLKREYKVKDVELGKIFVKIWNLLPSFKSVEFFHVPRKQNAQADSLVNEALDKAGK